MKRDILRFIGIIMLIIIFSIFIYPTPYYFTTTGADGGYKNIHRINRLTGDVDILGSDGWKRIAND
jgi:hypothetical protein